MIPIENAKKFTDITPAETIKEEDLILLHDGTGVKSADFKKIRESLVLNIFGNPNLLDNAYFMGDGQAGNFPIDQNNDGIPDRWSIVNENTEIEYSENGIKITNNTTTSENVICFRQNFNHIRNDLPITVSVFVKEFSGTWFFAGPSIPSIKITSAGVVSVTIEPNQGNYSSFYIFKNSTGANDYIHFQVAKIEYGRTQTVGHKEGDNWILDECPPNYQQELAKCQRCYYKIGTANDDSLPTPLGFGIGNTEDTVIVQLNLPVPMRIAPTVMFHGTLEVVGKDSTGSVKGMLVKNITPYNYDTCNCVSLMIRTDSGIAVGNLYSLRSYYNPGSYIELSSEIL